MQNNFQQQNLIVNQTVGQLMTQNNGIVTNSLPHENQVAHNNIVESQPMQGNPPVLYTMLGASPN